MRAAAAFRIVRYCQAFVHFGYIASQKPLDRRGIAGPIPLLCG